MKNNKIKATIVGIALLLAGAFINPIGVAEGARRPKITITVDPAYIGQTITGTVSPVPSIPRNTDGPFMGFECYQNGVGVWADGDYTTAPSFGTFASSRILWSVLVDTTSPADCRTYIGYVTQDGLGKWVTIATSETFVATP